jgi:hypothetical protein
MLIGIKQCSARSIARQDSALKEINVNMRMERKRFDSRKNVNKK